jgi:hypothetical protein
VPKNRYIFIKIFAVKLAKKLKKTVVIYNRFNDVKVEVDKKDAEIRRLCERIIYLEDDSKNSLLKIHGLREEFEATSAGLEETRSSTDRAIKALSLELRALKLENEKMRSRESQVKNKEFFYLGQTVNLSKKIRRTSCFFLFIFLIKIVIFSFSFFYF